MYNLWLLLFVQFHSFNCITTTLKYKSNYFAINYDLLYPVVVVAFTQLPFMDRARTKYTWWWPTSTTDQIGLKRYKSFRSFNKNDFIFLFSVCNHMDFNWEYNIIECCHFCIIDKLLNYYCCHITFYVPSLCMDWRFVWIRNLIRFDRSELMVRRYDLREIIHSLRCIPMLIRTMLQAEFGQARTMGTNWALAFSASAVTWILSDISRKCLSSKISRKVAQNSSHERIQSNVKDKHIIYVLRVMSLACS